MASRLLLLIFVFNTFAKDLFAQSGDCVFKPPFYLMHFGKGSVQDVNTISLPLYDRVALPCPADGHYSYTAYTSGCFNGDWHTLTEDHTPGDVGGNMLLVNSAYNSGEFLVTNVSGFKPATVYQFGVWLMNVCRPSDKCPFPLLPNLTIRLQTPAGKTIAQFVTGELPRLSAPIWTKHRAQFTMPASETGLVLTMIDSAPGGCGNDFALDDISFSECVKTNPAKIVQEKKIPVVVVKKQQPVKRAETNAATPVHATVNKNNRIADVPKTEIPVIDKSFSNSQAVSVVPVPLVLKQRTNPLVKQIETEAGEIQLDLYDNGEIDGDTVSVYHNNKLIVDQQRLSQKPISFRIVVNKEQPHHELVMVANNLGSIPPNTSLMIVTTKERRYQVFISSTEQQNAKLVIDLKQ